MQMVAAQLQKPFAVLQPDGFEEQMSEWLQRTNPDAVFVAALSLKIPDSILSPPRLGFLNFHSGPLPAYRGPQPVFWQIRNRETSLGLTIHQMTDELDRGAIHRIESAPLEPTDTFGTANYKLSPLALNAAKALLDDFARDNRIEFTPQADSLAAFQAAPTPKDILIDWATQSAEEIERIARAANPTFMGALFSLKGAPAYVPQATPSTLSNGDKTPGTVVECSQDSGIIVQCAENTAVRLDLISTDRGVFTGARAIEIFGVKPNEILQTQPL